MHEEFLSHVSASRRRDPLFTQCDNGRTRGNRFKLKEGRCRLDVRKKLFTRKVVRPWHSCPESCGCPISGGIQGQVGWGPGQPELLGGSPANSRGLALAEF